jgi:mono/diheme cytochrome c family protein
LIRFLVALLWLAGCVGGWAGDVRAGRRVADEWCAECHRVAPDQPTGARPGHTLPPPVTAPSFMEIAARPGIDAYQLERFLHELHPPMPTYRLHPGERSDVVAYILSLRPSP